LRKVWSGRKRSLIFCRHRNSPVALRHTSVVTCFTIGDIVIAVGLPVRYASGSVSSSRCARVSTEVAWLNSSTEALIYATGKLKGVLF
jgi:vacuolar-type H+-ATPase catalytic subunit A/Vma1